MSKRDKFSDLLNVSEPTGGNQKRQIITDYVNTGTQETVFTAIKETASTGLQEPSNPETQKPVKKKATFDMDKELHTQLKTHAALKGVPMVDILEDLIKAYLTDTNPGD